jgi:hypothetical protein
VSSSCTAKPSSEGEGKIQGHEVESLVVTFIYPSPGFNLGVMYSVLSGGRREEENWVI